MLKSTLVMGFALLLVSCSAQESPEEIDENSLEMAGQAATTDVSQTRANAAEKLDARSRGYVICIAPGMTRPEQFCGNRCPRGYQFVSYDPSTPAKCETNLQDRCEQVANLHNELGWTGGHKTNFCKSRGFDGVINKSGSDYKGNGGGWCYKGSAEACQASLPGGSYAPAMLEVGYDVEQPYTESEVDALAKQVMTSGVSDDLPTGRCRITVSNIKQCTNGMTQRACYRVAANVGGVADWAEGATCP